MSKGLTLDANCTFQIQPAVGYLALTTGYGVCRSGYQHVGIQLGILRRVWLDIHLDGISDGIWFEQTRNSIVRITSRQWRLGLDDYRHNRHVLAVADDGILLETVVRFLLTARGPRVYF